MAYETQLLPGYDVAHYTNDHTFHDESNGQLVRPYVGTDTFFYEEDLGVPSDGTEPYDPLTASFDQLVRTEYESFEAYNATPTIWDRQADEAYQEQRMHGEALARTIALQSIKRVCEYRAQRPADTWIASTPVEPEPPMSSVDIMLAESRTLGEELRYQRDNPPTFDTVHLLYNKQHDTATLQLRIPPEVFPPSDVDSGPALASHQSETVAAPQSGSDRNEAASSPATGVVRESTNDGEGYANGITAEPSVSGREQKAEASMSDRTRTSELVDGSTAMRKERRPLGKIGRKASELWSVASLSARGAGRLLDRLKRQARN
ncbi:MAG TPA: hypothetical protein VJ843_04425 [Candidatus Saccharimonadales bacterium]|nr:hypothetical protein [Candidatus Saccharimonadales bacterium]